MEEKLKQVMAAVFEVDPIQINESTDPDSLENWDSLRQLNLVSALEEEFNVEFSEEEMSEMISYKLIRLFLKEKLDVD